MATPYTELPEDAFTYEDDWKEIVDSAASPASSHISNDAQEATLVGYVPWNKQRSAARHFLGYAYADATALRMYRENPAPHPLFPWLYAYDVSFTPYRVKSNSAAVNSAPYYESPFQGWDGLPLYVAYHEWVVATVRYRNFRCRFKADTAISTAQDEWRRNTYIDTEPKIEALQVTGGMSNLKFAESGGGAGEPVAGTTAFATPMPQILSKPSFVLNWLNVPWDYLSEYDDYFYPTKIMDRIGTVNADDFLGDFSPGTCLMQPPRFSIKTAPVANDVVDAPQRYVDVAIPFDYFAPSPKAVASIYYGHNLMPWAGDGTAAKPGNGKWYFCTRSGATTGVLTTENTLIPYVNHMEIFEHVLA